MEAVSQAEAWRDLFVMIGSCAGALVGLLFVVVSLHFDKISDLPDHNMRVTMQGARFNILHLLTVLLEAAVLIAPQPLAWAAVQLIVLNLIGLRLPLTIIAKYADKNITISERGRFPTILIATIIGADLLGAAGGAALFADAFWGLYLVTAAMLIKVVRSVLTAWMLIFAIRRPA